MDHHPSEASLRIPSTVNLDMSYDPMNTMMDDTDTLEKNNQQSSNVCVTRISRGDKPKSGMNASIAQQHSEDHEVVDKSFTLSDAKDDTPGAGDLNCSACSSAKTRITQVSVVKLPRDSATNTSVFNDSLHEAVEKSMQLPRHGSVRVTRANKREISTAFDGETSAKVGETQVRVTRLTKKSEIN